MGGGPRGGVRAEGPVSVPGACAGGLFRAGGLPPCPRLGLGLGVGVWGLWVWGSGVWGFVSGVRGSVPVGDGYAGGMRDETSSETCDLCSRNVKRWRFTVYLHRHLEVPGALAKQRRWCLAGYRSPSWR